MSKKISIGIIVAVIIAFILGGRFFPWGDYGTLFSRQGAPANLVSAPQGTLSMYVVASKDTSNPLYKTSIEYPQFSGEDLLNKSISDVVNGKIKEFKSNSEENWKARQDTTPAGEPVPSIPSSAPFYFSQTWQPKQLNRQYASFIIRCNSFIGGANEVQDIMAFNYDFEAKKIISLPDIFPGVSNYLGQISTLAREQLSNSLNATGDTHFPTDMLGSGTAPTLENFQNFVFDDDIVEFYFPKYQVAPGVYGEQHVAMPRAAIR